MSFSNFRTVLSRSHQSGVHSNVSSIALFSVSRRSSSSSSSPSSSSVTQAPLSSSIKSEVDTDPNPKPDDSDFLSSPASFSLPFQHKHDTDESEKFAAISEEESTTTTTETGLDHPRFAKQSKRRALASPTLPLEAVAISPGLQRSISQYVRPQKLRSRELRENYKHFGSVRARDTYKLNDRVDRADGLPRVTTPPSLYTPSQAAAYCTNRFPGTFAAHVHVFAEIQRILPQFSPSALLDFGSGPGTALLAATRILTSPSFHGRSLNISKSPWEEEEEERDNHNKSDKEENGKQNEEQLVNDIMKVKNDITEIENKELLVSSSKMRLSHAWLIDHSPEMIQVSGKILKKEPQVIEHVKDILRTRSLSEGPPKSRKYDLVCSSYTLSEMIRSTLADSPKENAGGMGIKAAAVSLAGEGDEKNSDSDNLMQSKNYVRQVDVREKVAEMRMRKMIRTLWRRTAPGGVLVIIEDGTAAGFEVVLYAREMLLNRYGVNGTNKTNDASTTTTKVAVDEKERNEIMKVLKKTKFNNDEDFTIELEQDFEHRGKDENQAVERDTYARVIAPCLHSRKCPLDGTVSRHRICRFVQRLNRPPLQRELYPRHNAFEDEFFSYIAIQKTPLNNNNNQIDKENDPDALHDNQWGRLIRAPLRRRQHFAIDACTRDAKLERRVITKLNAKPGYFAVARRTRWGDIWPRPPADNCAKVNF